MCSSSFTLSTHIHRREDHIREHPLSISEGGFVTPEQTLTDTQQGWNPKQSEGLRLYSHGEPQIAKQLGYSATRRLGACF